MAAVYEYRVDWHLDADNRPLVDRYYTAVEELLCTKPAGSLVLTTCVLCGMRFLTTPSNRRRTDLRCPFGCRRHSRKEDDCIRCKNYRATPKGKLRKKELNMQRSRKRKLLQQQKSGAPQQAQPNSDLADYLHQISAAVGEDVGSKEDFRQTFAGWQEKWRQRPLEHWLEYYKIPSSSDDGNRDKPT